MITITLRFVQDQDLTIQGSKIGRDNQGSRGQYREGDSNMINSSKADAHQTSLGVIFYLRTTIPS